MFVIAALACNFSASQTPTAIPPGTIAPSTTPALFDTPPAGEPSPTSAPVSAPLEITGKYLMAFHACDAAAAECRDPRNHQVYLAQSDDGAQWSLVPGWKPYPGSVPDVIRRGESLGLTATTHVESPGFAVNTP